jgi:hypothetical protein
MKIAPNNNGPFIFLLIRWLINGIGLLTKALIILILSSVIIATLLFFGKILYGFFTILISAFGGF